MQGKYRHIEWLELEGGVLTECAIMKKTPDGHTWFFPIKPLDNVDKTRLLNILRNRNSELYELWDLMSQITLGNGINALSYFNQLVKVRTPSGQILPFGSGQFGAPVSVPHFQESSPYVNNQVEPAEVARQVQEAAAVAKSSKGRTARG